MITDCSFGGFQLYVKEISESDIGPNFVSHIFPYSSVPYLEITGNRIPRYEVRGFFSNQTGLEKMEFLAICQKQKLQSFFHPDLGLQQCALVGISTSENDRQIGIVSFQMTLLQSNQPAKFSLFNVLTNPLGALNSVVNSGIGAVSGQFGGLIASTGISAITAATHTNLTAITNAIGSSTSLGRVSGVDSMLNGATLGRFAQDTTLSSSVMTSVASGSASQSNSQIVASLSAAASQAKSQSISNIKTSVSDATSDVSTLA
ncbi:hypothetical protein Gdia_0557 [Gluconacetobacter diazotrophicus PA1 5]|uniref:DNA circularization N-terminal domain-containing protein n=1 Tax=Gluconacetobacter diazotrophicus TaxID=33996 RepID=UPI000173B394|nr:DNA circularization N-terminal domain-containing protein [Gluconacetobacter diazotrophicus]ACI50350.1 hypothetical protein Gdia_0557 [Gluconacetobacter diazotrophicus PA1 5]